MTCGVILNPRSGSADDASIEAVEREAAARGYAVWHTTAQDDGAALARRALRAGCTRIVAAGGDGTVNQVFNGLATARALPRVELGVIPLGTGNDLARCLDLPLNDPAAAAALALQHPSRAIDLARLRVRGRIVRRFANVSAGGLAVAVDKAADSNAKARWGSLAYLAAALTQLKELPEYAVTIDVDDRSFCVSVRAVAIANGRYAAGGVPVAPSALLDDARLDVVIIPAQPLAATLIAGLKVWMGWHEQDEQVLMLRARRRVAVRSDPPMPFNADGEPLDVALAQTSFDLRPGALRIVAGDAPPAITGAPYAGAWASRPVRSVLLSHEPRGTKKREGTKAGDFGIKESRPVGSGERPLAFDSR